MIWCFALPSRIETLKHFIRWQDEHRRVAPYSSVLELCQCVHCMEESIPQKLPVQKSCNQHYIISMCTVFWGWHVGCSQLLPINGRPTTVRLYTAGWVSIRASGADRNQWKVESKWLQDCCCWTDLDSLPTRVSGRSSSLCLRGGLTAWTLHRWFRSGVGLGAGLLGRFSQRSWWSKIGSHLMQRVLDLLSNRTSRSWAESITRIFQ